MEKEDITTVSVTYRDGRTETWDTPDGWIRARERALSMNTNVLPTVFFEVYWTQPPVGEP